MSVQKRQSKKIPPIRPELPWSWHRSHDWRSQWEIVLRWHKRVEGARAREDVADFLYAFFQNCYVLRDWLPSDIFPPADVRMFLKKHIEMRLCRDIANMTKHGRLSQSATGSEPSLAREYQPRRRGRFGDDADFVVLSGGDTYDLRDISARCINAWRHFFSQHEVPTSPQQSDTGAR